MVNFMNFEEERKNLLKKCYLIESSKEFTEEYIRKFWNLIEYVNIFLLSGEDNFFGQFIIQVKRNISFNITWPISTEATTQGYKMYFNPFLILDLSLKEIGALIKHEVYHIMLNHYERKRMLENKVSSLAINIAMDIAVNQYIKNLPPFAKKIGNVDIEYGLELDEDMTMEQYAVKIQEVINIRMKNSPVKKSLDTFIKEIDMERVHDSWNNQDLTLDNLRDIKKRTAKSAYKGKAPRDIEKIILCYDEKGEIVWQNLLKRLISSSRAGYRKTVTRKDRRQPERLDLRGRLPESIPEILVAIDISASMSDKEVKAIMREILNICRNKLGKIRVIECDSEIRRVYQLNSVKDIKPRMDKKGSTAFTPVFKYIKENNLRNYVLIYFTDGVGEKELAVKPVNYKTIWVLTGEEELSLEKPYGSITRLQRDRREKYETTYGLEALKEVLNEWQR